MCVIAVSAKGQRQPSEREITNAFVNNPDGAGFMYAGADGKVHIRKGFMTLDELMEEIDVHQFTADDAVIYHFRISTQAGVNPQMTHPFPLTSELMNTRLQRVKCSVGVAHNGIISLTSSRNERDYSDTALFITKYMSKLIKSSDDIHDKRILSTIDRLAKSKLAIMDGNGDIETIGDFTEDDGILWSNTSYARKPFHLNYYIPAWSYYSDDDPDDFPGYWDEYNDYMESLQCEL